MMKNEIDEKRTGTLIVTQTFEGLDSVLLYHQANVSFTDKGCTSEERIAWLGDETDFNIDSCVKEIMHKPTPIGNADHVDIEVAYIPDDEPLLRQSIIVHASTGHLTSEELASIEDEFNVSLAPRHERMVRENIRYGPVYISPKEYGFYVRIPDPDPNNTNQWNKLTPEMRAIVLAAIKQGSRTIEFDTDEEYVEFLYAQN